MSEKEDLWPDEVQKKIIDLDIIKCVEILRETINCQYNNDSAENELAELKAENERLKAENLEMRNCINCFHFPADWEPDECCISFFCKAQNARYTDFSSCELWKELKHEKAK